MLVREKLYIYCGIILDLFFFFPFSFLPVVLHRHLRDYVCIRVSFGADCMDNS